MSNPPLISNQHLKHIVDLNNKFKALRNEILKVQHTLISDYNFLCANYHPDLVDVVYKELHILRPADISFTLYRNLTIAVQREVYAYLEKNHAYPVLSNLSNVDFAKQSVHVLLAKKCILCDKLTHDSQDCPKINTDYYNFFQRTLESLDPNIDKISNYIDPSLPSALYPENL